MKRIGEYARVIVAAAGWALVALLFCAFVSVWEMLKGARDR